MAQANEAKSEAEVIAAMAERMRALETALSVLLAAAEALLRETGGVEPAGFRMARAALARNEPEAR